MRGRSILFNCRHFILRHYFLITLAVFVSLLFYPVIVNSGLLSYPMDDTYIHMAMAKNLAEHGTWSINSQGFVSASSSLLYTLVLAVLFRIFGSGAYMYIPLGLNILVTLIILAFADRELAAAHRSPSLRFSVLMLMVLALPLPAITLMSMEHTLHLLLSLLTVSFFIRAILGQRPRDTAAAVLFTALLCSVRYESLFFLPPMLMILGARRRFGLGLMILAAALLPLLAFGAYSYSKGGMVLPNPVVIKGVVKAKEELLSRITPAPPREAGGIEGVAAHSQWGKALATGRKAALLAARILWRFFSKAWVFGIIVLTSIFILAKGPPWRRFWSQDVLFYIIFISVLAAHVVFAGIGRQYRYEVYFMGMGIVLLGLSFPRHGSLRAIIASDDYRKAAILLGAMVIPLLVGLMSRYDHRTFTLGDYLASASLLLPPVSFYMVRNLCRGVLTRAHVLLCVSLLVFLMPVLARGIAKQRVVPAAMRDIYGQQFQMGRFVNEFYSGSVVAVNDIGAVSFMGNATIVDLWGLGDDEVLLARIKGEYDPAYIKTLLRMKGASIVIVYDEWFGMYGGIPDNFLRAGSWSVRKSVVLGGNRVSFYALDLYELEGLRENLKTYEPSLPGWVTVDYNSSGG